MAKRGLIDGRDNLIINDYRPVWLCNPELNCECDKVNCQHECYHTLNKDYAYGDTAILPPIYPFAEQANQKLRAEQMGAISSAINRSKDPTTIKLVAKERPSRLQRLGITITLMLLSILGWSCIIWLIVWIERGVLRLF